MTARKFTVYKGLSRPLIYKGFRGKFIYWGIGAVLTGLVLGSVTMAVINMWLGTVVLIGCIVGGLLYIASRQKKGLYNKTRHRGIFIVTPFIYERPEV
ncbi:plasmid transfer protein [Mucilaginibacter rubeus]|uniref:Plasmid transfer protein n=1 Tax=Mucilaginibacter rubeus TaxID=2027860 RepID=A0AAE6MLG7_9SPHI|nr:MULTISPECIES: plasmid transfer protein [Mucilaginibacter]QEM07848.1 plasmid transfer protein [Mucilaginibacter rubeus]QEM20300.1 plasmid transfer protein [Mucilaginibacter gossypii]QTE42982.1 plasmid transfer protein [Mucilaginibacter rubeus]QTE49583.1 plasmid transfer protein [Mucilaginibacter rubeus]QTE54679.1 plasmid transfer protein [Mucilaginibacter rubeus]